MVNFASTDFQILNFISGGKKCSSMENKHATDERARKIHQREMEQENPSICSDLIFFSWRLEACWTEITLFSPEVQLDRTVVPGTRCATQDHEAHGAGQEKAAASGCEGIRAPRSAFCPSVL